jgi:hypothetical protein
MLHARPYHQFYHPNYWVILIFIIANDFAYIIFWYVRILLYTIAKFKILQLDIFFSFIVHNVSHMKRLICLGMLCNMNSTLLDYVAPQNQTHIGIFF